MSKQNLTELDIKFAEFAEKLVALNRASRDMVETLATSRARDLGFAPTQPARKARPLPAAAQPGYWTPAKKAAAAKRMRAYWKKRKATEKAKES